MADTSRDAAARLRLLVTLVIAGGVLTLVVAGVLAVRMAPPTTVGLLVSAAFVVACSVPLLHVRWGHNRESFTGAELGLVLGLSLVPVAWLVVLVGVGTLVVQLLARTHPVKAAYNAGASILGVGVLGGLLLLVTDPSAAGTDPLVAVALLAAALLYALWTGVAVAAAVATSQALPLSAVLSKGVRLRVVISVGNSVLGLSILALADFSQQALVAVPPFLVLLYIAYRAYLAASDERDAWRRLEESTRAVTSTDGQAVVQAALERAIALFSADRVEIVLEGHGEPQRHQLVANGRDPEEATSVTTWARARLETAHRYRGLLQVGMDGAVRLSPRELAVLTAFGQTVSAALENAQLFDDVRVQATQAVHAANHDALTGLPNRSRLQECAQRAFDGGTATTALLVVDLDHFKEINDTLGHSAGDRLLRQVGERLSGAVGEGDLVARLGGDEFAVLLPGLSDPAVADQVAASLLRVLAEPVESDGLRLVVESSIGVACHPQDGGTFEELLQRADVALYQAKSSRGSWRRYDQASDDSSVARLALVAELRAALASDELVVHYQPQVDLRSGEIVSMEALARWAHPRRGLLTPDDFVPAAEHSGLVHGFTLAVLEKAVAECALWRSHGRDLSVAVNLSARSLLDYDLPHDVAGVLRRHGLPGAHLVVEITETTMMTELDVIEDVLGRLRSLGIRLSVDDFGTGYSSLSFLRRVAVNEVKIDKSFVRGMLRSSDDAAIVAATLQLGTSLGLRTVAEGVESLELRHALAALGCPVVQGFQLGQPLPAQQTRELLGLTGPDGSLRPSLRLA